jgi:hypothetical protein
VFLVITGMLTRSRAALSAEDARRTADLVLDTLR